MAEQADTDLLLETPLAGLHRELGARMVPFAGYDMPVQYPTGIIAEHNWTRSNAGLFDVSHMGQCLIEAESFEAAAEALERLVPADVLSLRPGQQRYSQFLNEEGGTLDDLMITRTMTEGRLYLVVNAGRKEDDYGWLAQHLAPGVTLTRRDDLSLVALQGPKAEEVLAKLSPKVRDIAFMHYAELDLAGIKAQVSRSGYTGEDGFEISVSNADAPKLWDRLLEDPLVKPVGLGARDSLRLEAGLCLYGHELDETISPIEAGLLWSIQKRRRAGGGFIGAARIEREITEGTQRQRVGIKPDGRAPAREGTLIADMAGREIGKISSGGFGPSAGGPIAMGYVETGSAKAGTRITLLVRGQSLPGEIVTLPFIPNRFKR